MEDLDRVEPGAAQRQLGDLRALGLDWDEPVMWQSDRLDTYQTVLAELTAQGRTYECFCSRRDILEAPSAPHAPPGAYPGTCRDLNSRQRADRARTRPAALRLRAGVREAEVVDDYAGHYRAMVDDLVLRRNDGIPAYNLVVVVDDDAQQVGQVVRGDDLLASAPRQAYLAGVLGLPVPRYAHVPMAVNGEAGRRGDDGRLGTAGVDAGDRPVAAGTLRRAGGPGRTGGAGEPVDAPALLARFDPALIPREPWVVDTTALASGP